MDKLEKRRDDRVLLSLPFHYKVFRLEDLEKDVRDETLSLKAAVENVSQGGVQVVSSHPFAVGDVLELELVLPQAGKVRTVAKIVWSREDKKGGENRHRSGVQFIPVYEEDLKKLNDYLKG